MSRQRAKLGAGARPGRGLLWGAILFGGLVTSSCVTGSQHVSETAPATEDGITGASNDHAESATDVAPTEQATEQPEGDAATTDDVLSPETSSAFGEPYTLACEQIDTPPVEFELYRERALPEAASALDEIARLIGLVPLEQHLEVRAHVSFGPDAPETELYRGYSLDQRRADWVGEQLIGRGVNPDRFHVVGYGDSLPLADPSTDEGRAMNRRIEVWRCTRTPVE